MKKSIMLICSLAALLALTGCTSKSNDTISGDTMQIITIYNRDYIASDTTISELPSGYQYIGELPEEAANDTGLGGCKMYVVKELNNLTDFYLYQEYGNGSGEGENSSKQTQGSYVHCILMEITGQLVHLLKRSLFSYMKGRYLYEKS